MKIKPIASSSAGNCHAIEENGEVLLIDCGVSVKRIRQAIGSFENVVGCLVSHEHGDHCSHLKQLSEQTSVKIFCSDRVSEATGVNVCDTFEFQNFFIRPMPFNVTPVSLSHDVPCFGFLILTKTDSLFYATDTASIPYTFPGLKKVIIEANFDWGLISESEQKDFVTRRVINNHLDIDSAIEFIQRHPDLEEIWLAHLSDAHSNAEDFRQRVVKVVGVPVHICPK